MKGLVVILLLLIIASLGRALSAMSAGAGPAQSLRMVHALTWRVGLSVALFALLIGGYYFGWITPHAMR
jgi:TRAP-type C4-dicarboxylate transport system permease large subunit